MPAKTRHGHAIAKGKRASPTYQSWAHMLNRCRNDKFSGSRWYKDKGIAVCDRWLVFDNFLADMGERPDGTTLDRRESSKGYSPENCRWATSQIQNRHSRRMRMWKGKPMMMKEIAADLGITHQALNKRVARGVIVLEDA